MPPATERGVKQETEAVMDGRRGAGPVRKQWLWVAGGHNLKMLLTHPRGLRSRSATEKVRKKQSGGY